jgi:hypothetical protein
MAEQWVSAETEPKERDFRGFHRINSQHGARILERLDLTARERHAACNMPLPGLA